MPGRIPGAYACTPRIHKPFAPGFGGRICGNRSCGWSGTFPYLAADHAQLLSYLELTGLAGAGSHLYQQEGPIQTTSADVGSLAAIPYNFNSGGVISQDPSFRLGADLRAFELAGGGFQAQGGQGGGASKFPSTMDGTMSFIGGYVGQIDDIDFGGDFELHVLISCFKTGGYGWDLSAYEWPRGSGIIDLYFRVVQNGYGNSVAVSLPLAGRVSVGTPFVAICNLDVAAGLIKLSTSVGDDSYAEAAWSDVGTFDIGVSGAWTHGWHGLAGAHSYYGKCAQVFGVQYSGAADAAFGPANTRSFLAACDAA